MSVVASRSRRPLWVAAALLLMVVAVVVVGWLVLGRSGTTAGGPVDTPSDVGSSFPATAGRPAFSGSLVLENTGGEPAVLESVRPLDLPDGLEIVATHAVGPDRRKDFVGAGAAWPAPGYPKAVLRPVAGFTMAPSTQKSEWGTTNIVFVMRADRPGSYHWSYVEVTYRLGGERLRRVVPSLVHVCARAAGESLDDACADGDDIPFPTRDEAAKL